MVSVHMGVSAVRARSVKGQASASTGGSAVGARSAEGVVSARMGGSGVRARSVGGQASVSTGGSAVSARRVGGEHCQRGRRRCQCKECGVHVSVEGAGLPAWEAAQLVQAVLPHVHPHCTVRLVRHIHVSGGSFVSLSVHLGERSFA